MTHPLPTAFTGAPSLAPRIGRAIVGNLMYL